MSFIQEQTKKNQFRFVQEFPSFLSRCCSSLRLVEEGADPCHQWTRSEAPKPPAELLARCEVPTFTFYYCDRVKVRITRFLLKRELVIKDITPTTQWTDTEE